MTLRAIHDIVDFAVFETSVRRPLGLFLGSTLVSHSQPSRLQWESFATTKNRPMTDQPMEAANQSTATTGLSNVRAAVVQAAPVLFDTPKSLQILADLSADAAKQGAELVVFPEAFIGGYPKGHDFGVSLGMRTPEGREEFRRLFESAIEVPGPATEFIGSVANDHSLHLVVGVIEREGGTLYCTALIFGPDGQMLGKHRKLMPTALERVIWGSGDGSTLPVVTTKFGKIGSVICWENYMPLLRTAMYAKGIEFYCTITVDDRETWIPTVRHIALEGRCFVLSACQFLQRSGLPPDYPTERFPASQDVLIGGGSCIVGPLRQILAGPKYGEECILTAELDRAELARAKFDFDVVGHYARPDVFRLEVNEQPMKSVRLSINENSGQRPVCPGDDHEGGENIFGDGFHPRPPSQHVSQIVWHCEHCNFARISIS